MTEGSSTQTPRSCSPEGTKRWSLEPGRELSLWPGLHSALSPRRAEDGTRAHLPKLWDARWPRLALNPHSWSKFQDFALHLFCLLKTPS